MSMDNDDFPGSETSLNSKESFTVDPNNILIDPICGCTIETIAENNCVCSLDSQLEQLATCSKVTLEYNGCLRGLESKQFNGVGFTIGEINYALCRLIYLRQETDENEMEWKDVFGLLRWIVVDPKSSKISAWIDK